MDAEADMQGQGKEAWGVVVVWLVDDETIGVDVVIWGLHIRQMLRMLVARDSGFWEWRH